MSSTNKAYVVEASHRACRQVFQGLISDPNLLKKLERANGSLDVQNVFGNLKRQYVAGCKHAGVLPRVLHHSPLSKHILALGQAEFKRDSFARSNALKTLQDLKASRWMKN